MTCCSARFFGALAAVLQPTFLAIRSSASGRREPSLSPAIVATANKKKSMMDDREAAYLIKLSMERAERALEAFGECRIGECTLVAGITKVLSLSADEVDQLSRFLQTSPFGASALSGEADFVACCNAFAAKRQRKVNMTMARAAIK